MWIGNVDRFQVLVEIGGLERRCGTCDACDGCGVDGVLMVVENSKMC